MQIEKTLNEKKKRYDYLDALKTLAMIFVCAYHFSWATDLWYCPEGMNWIVYFNRFIFGILSTCIPIFFMVNGALLLSKKNLNYEKHLRKFFDLYFLTCLWRAITIFVISYVKGISIVSFGLSNLFNAIFLFGSVPDIDFAHFWFMNALLCIYVVYPLIYATFQSNNEPLIIGFLVTTFFAVIVAYDCSYLWPHISFLGNIDIMSIGRFNPFSGLVGCMLFYFILGWLLHKHRDKLKEIPTAILLLSLLVGAGLLCSEWLVISKDMQANWDSVFNGYSTIATLLMSVSIYAMAYKVFENISDTSSLAKVVRITGRNTLSVYFVHWIVGYTILIDIHSKLFFDLTGLTINFIKAFLLVLIISYLTEFARALVKKVGLHLSFESNK